MHKSHSFVDSIVTSHKESSQAEREQRRLDDPQQILMSYQYQQEVRALNEKLDALLQAKEREVNYLGKDIDQGYQRYGVEFQYEGYQGYGVELHYEGQEQLSYEREYQSNDFYPNYHNDQDPSYWGNNMENPEDQFYPNYHNDPNLSCWSDNMENPEDQFYFNELQYNQCDPQLMQQNMSYSFGNYQPGLQHANQQSYQPQFQFNQTQVPPQNQALEEDQTIVMLKQILENQTRAYSKVEKCIDGLNVKEKSTFGEMSTRVDTLAVDFENMENQVSNTAYTSQQTIGTLPEKSEPDQKVYINDIILRRKEQLPSGEPICLYHQAEMGQEKEVEETEIVFEEEDKKEAEAKDEVVKSVIMLNDEVSNIEKEKVVDEPNDTALIPPPYEPSLQKTPLDQQGEFGILGEKSEEYEKALDSHESILQSEKLEELVELDEIEKYNSKKRKRKNEDSPKEKMKSPHDKGILLRNCKVNDQLLTNSSLRVFPGKLVSRWSGPFRIKEGKPKRAVGWNENREFTVNGQRLKLYMGGEYDEGRTTVHLSEPQPPQ